MNDQGTSERENRLADTLGEAGLLAPLMNVLIEQIEMETKAKSRKRRKPPSAIRQMLMRHYPNASEDDLDYLESTT